MMTGVAAVAVVAADRGEIAIGVRQSTEDGTGLPLNPDRNVRWTLVANDRLVVLTTIKEPEGGASACRSPRYQQA